MLNAFYIRMIASQGLIVLAWGLFAGRMEIRLLGLLAIAVIALYSGREGLKAQKLTYVFYPAHLMAIVAMAGVVAS